MGWITKIVAVGVLGYIGYAAYDAHRAGLFSLPKLPDGAYFLSYANGLRGIVVDADVPSHASDSAPRYFRSLGTADPQRKYLGVPLEVQPWFEDAWSWCSMPTDEELQGFLEMPESFRKNFESARFDAVCRLEVEGDIIIRGLIFSVPRL